MASRIRGIIVKIGGNTKSLGNALKGVHNTIGNTWRSLYKYELDEQSRYLSKKRYTY